MTSAAGKKIPERIVYIFKLIQVVNKHEIAIMISEETQVREREYIVVVSRNKNTKMYGRDFYRDTIDSTNMSQQKDIRLA